MPSIPSNRSGNGSNIAKPATTGTNPLCFTVSLCGPPCGQTAQNDTPRATRSIRYLIPTFSVRFRFSFYLSLTLYASLPIFANLPSLGYALRHNRENSAIKNTYLHHIRNTSFYKVARLMQICHDDCAWWPKLVYTIFQSFFLVDGHENTRFTTHAIIYFVYFHVIGVRYE